MIMHNGDGSSDASLVPGLGPTSGFAVAAPLFKARGTYPTRPAKHPSQSGELKNGDISSCSEPVPWFAPVST